MAGPFGFDASHYDVSMADRRARAPCRRCVGAEQTTIIVANGFSCREQISQTTDRQALHPAQVLKMAFDDQGWQRQDVHPELRYMPDARKEARKAALQGSIGLAVLVGAAAAATLLLWKR